ncbi:hypothetical protein [Microbacterium memoriense]|uniref:TnsA-like heteromeric transposase endonuclease subunit n=1 Tax=Microbacterium memoriense TaxID=2978350 RepID=A0ABT2PCP0_9MICO|nr:hypothetical protein [Microbacterium memoriense]MCT9002343.1 hypothetical protein [Microbacterium memoriense]
MRVRTSKGVRHRFTNSMYFWQRTRSHVWCESQEERWELLWLDFGAQVERLWAQPMAIAFGHGSRLAGYSHVPDFLAQFTDGSYGLFDVRPEERLKLATRLQFDETAKTCETLGWHYRVLTGHDTLATRNLDLLVSAARRGASVDAIADQYSVTVEMARFRYNTTGVGKQVAMTRSR